MNSRTAPLVLALVASCVPSRHPLPASVDGPAYGGATPAAAPFRAAARAIDITPPPGISTFGHGPDARVSEGYWTRLECRAFAFEQGPRRILLLPCDLAASSTVLQRLIAKELTDVVPATRIFLSATHTHAGPAHYFDELAFNGPDSVQVPGYDPVLAQHIATAIASGARNAFAHLEEAELRQAHYDGGEPDPSPDDGMWGISWNRSLEAHRATSGGGDVPAPRGVRGVDAAIDPSLHWVELRNRVSHRPIGALSFFAVHPSVVSHNNRVFGADIDGVVSRVMETQLHEEAGTADDGPAPVVAVVNGNEGDMSPVWTKGTKAEAVEVGRKIAARLGKLRTASGEWHADARLDAHYEEIDVGSAKVGPGASTCRNAELGESAAFGACDHLTEDKSGPPFPMYPNDDCQRPKKTPAGELEHVLAGGAYSFPWRVPIGVVRLDDLIIGAVPAEVTIKAGRKMRREMLDMVPEARHAVLAGLTNGYILYVTDKDEYDWTGDRGGCLLATDGRTRQSYEGASTLYGAGTASLLTEHLGRLAGAFSGSPALGMDHATGFSVATEPVRIHYLDGRSDTTAPQALGLCRMAEERALCFRWQSGPPETFYTTPAPWIAVARTIDRTSGRDLVDDDRGLNFIVRAGAATNEWTRWSALWRWDGTGRPPVGGLRFLVFGNHRIPRIESSSFESPEQVPACAPEMAAACGSFEDPGETTAYHPGWNGAIPQR